MQKPIGYDTTEAKVGGAEFDRPEAGGYVLGIVNAIVKLSKNENEMLELYLDIAEGKYKNYYRQMSESLKKNCYLRHYRLTQNENALPYLKGDIKAIEHSNPGFVYDWEETSLIRKLVGANLREEEYQPDKFSLRVSYLCDIKNVRDGIVKPLKPKLLPAESKSQNVQPKEDEKLPF